MCLHKGNYDELATLYNEMSQWSKSNGYERSRMFYQSALPKAVSQLIQLAEDANQ